MRLKTLLITALAISSTPLAASPQDQASPKPATKVAEQDAKQGGKQGDKEMSWTGVLGEKEFAALHELKKGEAPKLHGTMVEVAGGKHYLSLPKKGKPKAAVLVIHEWWGLNANVKHWTDRLAADGYAALAVDLYNGVVATSRDGALEAMRSVDADKATKTLLAALRFLKEDKRVRAKRRACIGWCFGGGWSLKLAIAAPDLDAAVIYYGRLIRDAKQLAPIKAKVLGIFGNKDRGIPPKSVDAFEAAMIKANKSVEIHRYDANHAFANPSSARYDAKNAAAAWKRTRVFLRSYLLGPKKKGAERPSFAAGRRRISYELPLGWKLKRPAPMRNVNFDIGKGMQCYVTVLGGAAGGIGPNVNRWRAQLGLEEAGDDEVAKLPKLEMLGKKAIYVAIDGSYTSRDGEQVDPARMLAVICPMEGNVVFVKLIGPGKGVKANEAKFKAFCKSLR